jgi:aromatic-L-amino-acid decarboxylase
MTGDFGPDELRAALARVADLLADYFERVGDLPVLPPASPGDLLALLPPSAPETPEPLDRIFDDYRRLIEPHTTHWNHPGFLAYFAISGSVPGIAAEALSAGLNVNGMLWRTGPALTELEERTCDWLRQLMGLPDSFRGHMNDTASVSSLLALAAARERAGLDIRQRGMAGRTDLPPLTVYASEHAHSSIDKAIITLGLGIEALRKVPADAEFRMDAPALAARIAADRAAGCRPIAVVATAGTTSSTSVDPVAEIAAIAEREGLWLHVDAAYAGSAAICPELQRLFAGWERADSIVTNPHKWLFVPVDCSLLYVRDEDTLRQAFSLVPEYLKTSDGEVRNLMDLGIQLGRKFRALKLWTVMRAYGAEGLRERIRAHCRLARDFAAWVDADARFERVAPVPFSTVCFRFVGGPPARADERNQRLLDAVNARGPVLLSHTKLDGRLVLRVAIGNIRTDREHLQTAWRLLREEADRL